MPQIFQGQSSAPVFGSTCLSHRQAHRNRCPLKKKTKDADEIFKWTPPPDHYAEHHTRVEIMLHDLVRRHYFTYAIFWKEEAGIATFHSGYTDDINEKAMAEQGLLTFTEHSKDVTFHMHEGMIGRVMASQKYEWIDNVQNLPVATFKRVQAARDSHIKTVAAFAVNGGVVEVGCVMVVRPDKRVVTDIKGRFHLEFSNSHFWVDTNGAHLHH